MGNVRQSERGGLGDNQLETCAAPPKLRYSRDTRTPCEEKNHNKSEEGHSSIPT